QERVHRLLGVEKSFVHVDVDDLRAALDLLARNLDGGRTVALQDQLLEARRAGDVGALADIDEGGALRCALGVVVFVGHQKKLAASMPESRSAGGSACHCRGCTPLTASAIARMCAGVVPQQPPTMFSQPFSAQPLTSFAVISGGSSYAPNSFGRPAFG